MNFITCPNCKMQVIPKTDGTCPSCQATLSIDKQGRVRISQPPAGKAGPVIPPNSRRRRPMKSALIAVAFLLLGLVLIRILVAWSAAGRAKSISQKYLMEWSGVPGDKLLSTMEQDINAINPRPFGYNRDGLLNEPFDDEVAFDASGLLSVDAHDSIAGLTEHFQITSVIVKQGLLGTTDDRAAMSSRLVSLGEMLVRYRFKARVAQELGMLDTLAGLTGIVLLGMAGFYVLKRRR